MLLPSVSPMGWPLTSVSEGEEMMRSEMPGARAEMLMRARTPEPESWYGGALRSTAEA